MQRKTIYQQFNDFVFPWRGYLCHLFQKGLALGLTFNVLLLVRNGAMVALSIQTYGVATAFSTGMVFFIARNAIALNSTPAGGLRKYCCTAER